MSHEALTAYVATLAVAETLLKKQIIGKKDFFILEKAMMRKYGFSENSIFRDYRIVCQGSLRGKSKSLYSLYFAICASYSRFEYAFVGSSDFAKSYQTSEYLFRFFKENTMFDLTPVVSGSSFLPHINLSNTCFERR